MHPDPNPESRLHGTVLVVDDDEGVRETLTRWIDQLGYDVRVAADAEAALDTIHLGTIDVVVCDLRLPGCDGVWLAEQFRRHYPHTAIVLATGLPEIDPTLMLRPGVVGCILKPFHREELDELIQVGLREAIEGVVVAPS